MNRASEEYRVGVGASTILMIFVVLTLTTLGVLAFASARADLVLTQRRQAQVEAYYAAAADAQALIAKVDAALLRAGTADDAQGRREALTAIDPRIRMEADDIVAITLEATPSQELRVRIRLEPAEGGERYTLLSHQLVNTASWEPETGVELASPSTPNP